MKVSIIVPVYNNELYLDTCLKSLLNQTNKNIEIIAIDDASSDNSFSILKEYENKYPNLHIYQNKSNLGAGATRNIGLMHASGDYIGFVDSDDYVSLTMYESMINACIKYNNPDIVETNLIFTTSDKYAFTDLTYAKTDFSRIIKNTEVIKRLLETSPSVCNKLFKKGLISEHKFLENCKWEDIAFTSTMYMNAKSVAILNNPDYFYRRDISRGISSINYQENKKVYEIFKVTDEIIDEAKKINKYDIYYKELLEICFGSIFNRIDEINNWNIDYISMQEVKNSIYSLTYQKYGSLDDIDLGLLSTKTSLDTILEYQNYLSDLRKEATYKK